MKKLLILQIFIFHYLYSQISSDIKKDQPQFQSYFTLLKEKQEQEKKESDRTRKDIQTIEQKVTSDIVPSKIIVEQNHFSITDYLSAIFREPELTLKTISIDAGPSTIQDVIQLIGKTAKIDFVIDSDVKGNIDKISFKNVTPGFILNKILTQNYPPLALVKDLNAWRILPRDKAEHLVKQIKSAKPSNIISSIIELKYLIINDRFKDLIDKTWTSIVEDKRPFSPLFIYPEIKKIYVRGEPSKIDELKKFIFEIDKPITQIRIDAIIVFCQKNYNFDYGINWSGIYNRLATIQLKNKGFGFVGLGGTLDDFPTPTLPINPRFGDLFVNPENFAINLFTKIFRTPAAADPVPISNTAITVPFVFGGPDLNTRRLNLLLNAAESESKVKIVSRPSIMTSDNEVAKILIGSTIPIQATGIDILTVAVQNITSINYKDIGISLEVQPIVSPDKKNIKLEIFIEESEVVGGTTLTNDRGIMQNPPIIDIIKVHNKVNLKNGQTVIIGGLSSCDERKGKNRVPILSQLPIVGGLFKSTSEFKKEFEQFIFITPTIVEGCASEN